MISVEDIDSIGQKAQTMSAQRGRLSGISVHAVGHEAASKAYAEAANDFEKALANLRKKAASSQKG